jgi:hypothetical protein
VDGSRPDCWGYLAERAADPSARVADFR